MGSSSPHSQSTVEAVAATVAATLLLAGIVFYVYHRFAMARLRQRNKSKRSFRREEEAKEDQCQELGQQQGGGLKGIIVDENGVDVVYLRKLEGGQLRRCFSKIWINPMEEEQEQEQEQEERMDIKEGEIKTFESTKKIPLLNKPLPTPPPPPPKPLNLTKKPQLAPPRDGGLASYLGPPPSRRGKESNSGKEEALQGERSKGIIDDTKVKLKPLHWDKVAANATDHSVVWDEINDGSFRFDDEQMEALFGYKTLNHKSSESDTISGSAYANSAHPAKTFILGPRKSQNTAIVLKSLSISRKEILDALIEGRGLNADTLEKLTKISPTAEEVSKITQFNGNPTELADAEFYLHHILKAVPSAFLRLKAMLFRSNYDPEILHLKESLQTFELGCKELRTRGVFLKLLEAILKAGNRMNAGTPRGNAQGFDLTALTKLSHMKSTDGRTTLLHFVVEQVARAEGKRSLVLHDCEKRNKNELNSDKLTMNEENEKEYLLLGLPVLGELSTEFSNVKKAATIDYETFTNTCPTLIARVTEIRQLVIQCGNGDGGGFVREMKGFLEECEDELKVVKGEQTKVMELVKKTTEYYQAGDSKDQGRHPLQLFVIVKDFLDKVDQVCIDITTKMEKKKKSPSSVGSSPPMSPSSRTPLTFQNLQSQFVLYKSGAASSDSEDDF